MRTSLQSQIELAVREEQLVAQKGQNERRRAEESAAAQDIAPGRRLTANVPLLQRRRTPLASWGAEAEAETARLAAAGSVDAATLIALAVREVAGNLPAIGTLNLTPDLITAALARVDRWDDAMSLAPRAVLVHRRTEGDELLLRHGSRGAASFFSASGAGTSPRSSSATWPCTRQWIA